MATQEKHKVVIEKGVFKIGHPKSCKDVVNCEVWAAVNKLYDDDKTKPKIGEYEALVKDGELELTPQK